MRPREVDHAGTRTAEYLLGALTAEQDHRFEAHLLRCWPCLTEADALSEVAVAVTRLPSLLSSRC
jgi:hypothetical protein